VRICFENQSCIDVRAPEFADSSFTWRAVIGSAIDAEGNAIAQGISDMLEDTFQFSDSLSGQGAFEAFIDRAGNFGFQNSYSGGGSGCPGSFTRTVTCSNVNGDKRCMTMCI
jgi:hypothetical protein